MNSTHNNFGLLCTCRVAVPLRDKVHGWVGALQHQKQIWQLPATSRTVGAELLELWTDFSQ